MINLPDIIYKSFTQREAKVPNGKVTFAPSYLSDCGRKIYYSKTGEKPTNPIELPSLLKMEWGNILHDDMQKRLQDAGVLESFEEWRTATCEGLEFIYRYDGILSIDAVRYIMEIKTVYASGYKSIEESPKPEHIQQAISYMNFEGIDKAIILYAGRDNGYLKQHTIELNGSCLVNGVKTDDHKKWYENIQRMRYLKSLIETNQLPDRDFKIVLKHDKGVITEDFQKDSVKYKSDWQCSYCGFKELCWKKEYEQIKDFKFFINNQFIKA